jgi:DNA end-binding protein Ku
MARAIWSGSISFGLLNVPVKLYSAVSKQTVRFKELTKDGSRVRHKRVSEETGKEISYDDIVKGYEFAPDQYVTLTRDELSELDPKKTRAIEIQDFVDIEDIDPIYFEHPYYLGPDKGAAKAYSLLVEAMKQSRKAAIARFVLRNKEHLAAIRPMGQVLTMATMRFHDEVSDPSDMKDDLFSDEKPSKPDKRELEMAQALIDSLSTEFKADKYEDQYREELLAMLESKAEGKEIVSAPTEEPEPTKAPDLMAALEESLAAVRGEDGAEAKTASKSNGSGSKPKAKKSSASSKSKTSASKKASTKRKAPAKKKTASKSKAKAGTK